MEKNVLFPTEKFLFYYKKNNKPIEGYPENAFFNVGTIEKVMPAGQEK